MKIVRALVAAALALAPASAFAFGLPGADPYVPNVVECMAGLGDVDVSSFGDVLTYQIKGTCKMSVLHIKGAWVPAGPYDVVATWRSSDGAFHERIHGPQSISQNALEPQHGPWEMELGGTCKLDPFMTGADASSCSGHVISSSNAIFTFSDKNFPVSPRVIPASLRPGLTAKTLEAIEAEHQAPRILKPEEGKTYSDGLPLSIDAGKGSPTKTFKLEWQAWIDPDPSKPGDWARALGMLEETGATGNVPQSAIREYPKWRVRARASQSANAAWCEWRTFLTPEKKPPCDITGPYGAKYVTSATPATMTPNQIVTVAIGITNTGTKTWTVAGYHLSYHWLQNGAPIVFDGQKTSIGLDIGTCLGTTVGAKLVAPPTPATYTLEWDMEEDGVTWFSQKGVQTGNRTVTVAFGAAPPTPPPPKK